MADNKWHLVSTFDRTQTLEEFCNSIDFTIDSDEKYIYRIRDGIEASEQVKKVNWYRITIKDDDSNNVGKVATYDSGSWQEDSNIEDEINLRNNTAYWMYGQEGDKIKGQWGSRGTGTGVMDIKSIFLSVLPYPTQNEAAVANSSPSYSTATHLWSGPYDVLARVEFTDQTDDIIYFQKGDSKDKMFKKFEEVFNETKNVDDKVCFEFSDKNSYFAWDFNLPIEKNAIYNIIRSTSNERTISDTVTARSPDYTNAKEAWNGLFCFKKLDSTKTIYFYNFRNQLASQRTGKWELDFRGGHPTSLYLHVQYADLLAIKE